MLDSIREVRRRLGSAARVWLVTGAVCSRVWAQDAAVADAEAGTGRLGALFRVNLTTGTRTLVSDFGNPAQGPLGSDPWSVTEVPAGVVVVDPKAGSPCGAVGCGAVFLVNLTTGVRTLVSDFGNPAQGPVSNAVLGLYGSAVDGNGDLLVTDRRSGGSGRGLLYRVSLSSGGRTIISDFANPAQGPLGGEPSGVFVEPAGSILVADANTGSFPAGAVFRIDPVTGMRTIVSDFTNAAQGPLGSLPVAVFPAVGTLWVADQAQRAFPAAPGFGQLFRVDAASGVRTMVSDFSTAAQGPLGFNLNDVKIVANGAVLVLDFDAGTNSLGALFTVNAATGARAYLSDFGNSAQGPLGAEPAGFVLLAPPPPPPPPANLLTVVIQGDGVGLVGSEPAGIDCGTDCTENYPAGTVVQLVAVTGPNARFAGWSGHPDCADGVVQMNLAQNCIATFNKQGGRIILAPDLTAIYDSPHLIQLGTIADPGPYRISLDYVNRGPVAAGQALARAYLSTDRKLSADDVLLGERYLPPMNAAPAWGYISIVSGVLKGTVGTYYLILVLDALNQVGESDERNNVLVTRFTLPCHAPVGALAVCTPK